MTELLKAQTWSTLMGHCCGLQLKQPIAYVQGVGAETSDCCMLARGVGSEDGTSKGIAVYDQDGASLGSSGGWAASLPKDLLQSSLTAACSEECVYIQGTCGRSVRLSQTRTVAQVCAGSVCWERAQRGASIVIDDEPAHKDLTGLQLGVARG